MNIKILHIGKIKEKYFKQAISEYEKRLQSYCKINFISVGTEQILDENLHDKYKSIEAEKIFSKIKDTDYLVALDILGETFSSENFAREIQSIANIGVNEITFVIGGANGLDKRVLERANLRISFSKMTFTHQMILVILTEQIYRAYKILNNENYHR